MNRKRNDYVYSIISELIHSKILLGLLILLLGISIFEKYPELSFVFLMIGVISYKLPYVVSRIIATDFTKNQFRMMLTAFTPRQFEEFCYELFQALGYNAYLMEDGPDGGKDVILDNKIYVECKRYNSDTVGREICQKLLGAVTADKKEAGIIFTNGKIAPTATEFVDRVENLSIWDFDKIYEAANSLERYELSNIIDSIIDNSCDNNEFQEFET